MVKLNLPVFNIKTKIVENKKYVFDDIRKKWIILTPEEWVRQNFIHYLIHDKNYPGSLISIEAGIKVNKMRRRGDIIIYKDNFPRIIIECKSPDVELTQDVFDQIAQYNIPLKVDYLIVTNGLKHFCCKMDYQKSSYSFLNEIPDYSYLT